MAGKIKTSNTVLWIMGVINKLLSTFRVIVKALVIIDKIFIILNNLQLGGIKEMAPLTQLRRTICQLFTNKGVNVMREFELYLCKSCDRQIADFSVLEKQTNSSIQTSNTSNL